MQFQGLELPKRYHGLFTMAEIYFTLCPLWERQFKTRKALEKHYTQKHPGNDVPESTVFASGNK